MARTRIDTLRKINRFIEEANKKIEVKKVILFGSYASGRVSEWSDIDIAVISDDFEGMDYRERLLFLNKIAWTQQVSEVDALGYTEAEFEAESPLDFATEIKAHGIVVYEKS